MSVVEQNPFYIKLQRSDMLIAARPYKLSAKQLDFINRNTLNHKIQKGIFHHNQFQIFSGALNTLP